MSVEIDIVCRNVRDHLRFHVPLRDEECWCRVDEKVPPFLGEHFVSVYPGQYGPATSPQHIDFQDRFLGINVGITHRTGLVPLDRMYQYAYDPEKGIATWAERINKILERDRWQLLGAFQSEISDWDFVEPLQLSNPDLAVRVVDEEHFTAPPDNTRQPAFEQYFGLFGNLEYTVGRIMQGFQIVPPEAHFIAEEIEPKVVKFRNRSSGIAFTQIWAFGDGEGSQQHSPHHVYEFPGEYSVTLSIEGPGGRSATGGRITVKG